MGLLSEEITAKLLANGQQQLRLKGTGREMDFYPVVKIHSPMANAKWLLTELDPEDPDIAFGLCDLGYPELGYVSISEIESIVMPFGCHFEIDGNFQPTKPLSRYALDARHFGSINV